MDNFVVFNYVTYGMFKLVNGLQFAAYLSLLTIDDASVCHSVRLESDGEQTQYGERIGQEK